MTDHLKTDGSNNMGAYEIPTLSLFRPKCTKKTTATINEVTESLHQDSIESS